MIDLHKMNIALEIKITNIFEIDIIFCVTNTNQQFFIVRCKDPTRCIVFN